MNVVAGGEDLENRVYFGIPIGAIKLEEYGLEADVYASDEHTINFQNFSYDPTKPGCKTSLSLLKNDFCHHCHKIMRNKTYS